MANDLWYAFKAMSVEDQKAHIWALRAAGMTDNEIQRSFDLYRGSWDRWKAINKMWAGGRPGKKMKKKTKSDWAICWECKKACGGCSWSKTLTPVEGWEVVETGDPTWLSSIRKVVPTVRVVECPEFIKG